MLCKKDMKFIIEYHQKEYDLDVNEVLSLLVSNPEYFIKIKIAVEITNAIFPIFPINTK